MLLAPPTAFQVFDGQGRAEKMVGPSSFPGKERRVGAVEGSIRRVRREGAEGGCGRTGEWEVKGGREGRKAR